MLKREGKNQGFSLIELLLVIGIGVIIFAFSLPYGLDFYRRQLVEDLRSNMVEALQRTRHMAVLQKNDSDFGLKIDDENNQYVVFQGSSYAGRDENQDEIYEFVSQISPSGLGEVVFGKMTGLPSATGTITLTYGTIIKALAIDDSGTISKD